jgi:hypothetical protein
MNIGKYLEALKLSDQDIQLSLYIQSRHLNINNANIIIHVLLLLGEKCFAPVAQASIHSRQGTLHTLSAEMAPMPLSFLVFRQLCSHPT